MESSDFASHRYSSIFSDIVRRMNASQLMDKQVKDLSSIGSDIYPSRDELFLDLVNSHLPVHLDEAIAADEAHSSEAAPNHRPSYLHGSSVYAADEAEEEIVPSYDFHPIRPLESRASCSRVRPPSDSKSSINFPQNLKPTDSFEPNRGKEREALNVGDLLSEIDRVMKTHVGEMLHSLEGVSARLTQVETRIRTLEGSVDEVKVASGANNGVTDMKIRQLENILYKIQSVVVSIKDDIEAKSHSDKPEAPKHTFDTQTVQTSSHHFQPSSLPTPSDQFSPPDPHHHHSSSDTYHLPHLPAIQPPYIPPPQLVPPAIPQNPPQQSHLPALPPQQPHFPVPPPQQTHFHAPPPLQSHFPAPPPQQPQAPALPPQESHLPALQHQGSYLPSVPHQQPHLPSAAPQQLRIPSTPPQQPHLPQMPPPAVPQQPYPTVYPPQSSPNAQGYYDSPAVPQQGYDTPSGLYSGGYGGFGSDSYSYGSGKPAQLPTARMLPEALPTGSRVEGSGQSGSAAKFPVDDVVDRVSSMGFSREQVRATVQKLTENGQSVELNVVLDKLMNDGEVQNRRGPWFG